MSMLFSSPRRISSESSAKHSKRFCLPFCLFAAHDYKIVIITLPVLQHPTLHCTTF
jgi:hypothetical protein